MGWMIMALGMVFMLVGATKSVSGAGDDGER